MVSKESRKAVRSKKHWRMRKTLVASTLEKEAKSALENTDTVEAAAYVGKLIAERAASKGISQVVFDRGGFLYTGKVKALADAAREAGLQF